MAKVKITAWVDERTAGVLRALAAQHEISVSEATAQTLQRAVEDRAAEGIGTELLLPAVKGAVRREVARMGDRLAHLMARSALESATGRRLLFQLLAEEIGRDEANRRNRSAWTASGMCGTHPLTQIFRPPAAGTPPMFQRACRI